MEAQSSSWAGHMAIPPEDRAVLSSLLFSSLAGKRPSVQGRRLHPVFSLCSSLLPITPLLEANLMFPAEHHESAGLRPIILWLLAIMTLGRTEEKTSKMD